MLSNIETLAANMQNVEKGIKAKNKNKNHENVSRDKKKFKSATELDTDGFLAIFEFLNVAPDYKAKQGSKIYSQNIKPRMKSKLCPADQFFVYLIWLRNGFT